MARSSRQCCTWSGIGLLVLTSVASVPLLVILAIGDILPFAHSNGGGVIAAASGVVDAERLAEAERRAAEAERRAADLARVAADAERLASELRSNSSEAAKMWWSQASAQADMPPPKTGTKTPYLVTGETLDVGDYLLSADQSSHAIMQKDGHFVVYRGGKPDAPQGFMWGTGQSGAQSSTYCVRMEEKYFSVWKDKRFRSKFWTVDGLERCRGSSNDKGQFFLWLHSGGRLAVHRGTPQSSGEEIWSNQLGIPTYTGKPRRYIFYERDRAGFNNVKLQLQSMVVIAAITGRILVLPARSHIDHQKAFYFDFDFFDASDMSRVVDIAVGKDKDESAVEITEALHSLNFRKLSPDKDWYFPEKNSRIQHFECLSLEGADKSIAAHAVLNGLPFDRHLEEMATSALQRLGLAGTAFDAVHIRRGDFHKFASHFMMSDDELSRKLRSMLHGGGRPVLVASDEKLKLDLAGSRVVYASEAYGDESSFTRVAVDMIMCARANKFIGTPMSTFTNGIFELRKRSVRLKDAKVDATDYVYAGKIRTTSAREVCWDKVTTFEGVEGCEHGFPRCLRPC